MTKGKMVVVSAPSGAGKSTIVEHLLKSFPKLSFSISATTRNPRGEERHGVEYFFFTKGEFQNFIEADDLVEWEEVYEGVFYGTLKSEVERLLEEGKHVIFDIDVQGGLNIKEQFGDRCISLFVDPPNMEVLEQRLKGRGTESEGQLNMRLNKAEEEISQKGKFDFIIVNDDLAEAKKEAEKMVRTFLNED